MFELKVYSSFEFQVNSKFEKECELYIDSFPHSPKSSFRILLIIEPWMGNNALDFLSKNRDNIDLVLCWHENVLESISYAKLFPFGTSWIRDFDLSIEKQFCVTTLIGGKNFMSNHKLRHDLIMFSDDTYLNIPIHFFNSKNYQFNEANGFRQMQNPEVKNELFYSQYHIAIENVSENNWFTEKLIDCFQTMTVPIYIGCPNISDFFNPNGVIHVSNLDEMREKLKLITPETYSKMKSAIDENYELSKQYVSLGKSLEIEISKFLLTR